MPVNVKDFLLWFWIGWEPGTQYVYKYVGRSTAGIHKLKQQNAVVELESTVTVQSIDDSTLVVQVLICLNICLQLWERYEWKFVSADGLSR